ncbi:MAG: O-antigen ligase family protein [Trueperaceae bacterium]
MLAIPAIPSAVDGDWHKVTAILGQALVVLVMGSLLRLTRTQLLVVVLALLAMAVVYIAILERPQRHGWAWPSGESIRIMDEGGVLLFQADSNAVGVSHAWWLPRAGSQVLLAADVTVRSQTDFPRWVGPNPSTLSPLAGEPSSGTVVYAPGEGGYIYQSHVSRSPIAGETFRATFEVRAREGSDCGNLVLTARGYQVNRSVVVCPTRNWSVHQAIWTVPMEVSSSIVDVVLNGFEQVSLEVRSPVVERFQDGDWVDLGPLRPNRTEVSLSSYGIPNFLVREARPYRGDASASAVSLANIESKRVRLSTLMPHSLAGSIVRAELLLPANAAVAIGPISFSTPENTPLTAIPLNGTSHGRASLWFPHPNLAGHTLAAATATVAGIAPVGIPVVMALIVSLVVILETGSRSALFVVIGAVVLTLQRILSSRGVSARRMWWLGLGLATSILVLVLVVQGFTHFIGPRFAATPRLNTWLAAWNAMTDFPVFGLEVSFASYFSDWADGARREVVQHAHNFWLQQGASYGVSGFLSAIAFTLGLLSLAQRGRHPKPLSSVLLVLTLQVFDTSLFFFPVLGFVVLAVNSNVVEHAAQET